MPTPIELQPFGPDLSHHNGAVNFDDVKRAGASFVILKATQGTRFADPNYKFNLMRAQRAGLIVGSYHYLSYEHPPRAQANFYANTVGDAGGIFPIVDIENDDDDPETGKQYSAGYMSKMAADFIDEIHSLTGKYPTIYTYVSFWRDTLHNPTLYAANCPLWIADYSQRKPRLVGGWKWHTFHQYTSTGHLLGVPGSVDLNRFNGSLENLKKFAGV